MDARAQHASSGRAAKAQRQRHPKAEPPASPSPPGVPGVGSPAARLLALQRTAGNSAVARAVTVQRTLTNDATWGAVEATTGQGTSVRAVSGPSYKYGSKPATSKGFRPYDYTAMFSAATGPAFYCQGHLLNDNLGGPGDPTP
ncbi:hypothetical protein, partial [Intrasporangium sp.]|uniref:hypothetical protein n=1 Tax=Intrasporangium sp. TaxID=1925024 RepID=UPI002647F0CA